MKQQMSSGETSEADEPRFMFVNEDIKSFTSGVTNHQRDRSKQSHVQRQYLARHRKSKEAQVPVTKPAVKTKALSDSIPTRVRTPSLQPASKRRSRFSTPDVWQDANLNGRKDDVASRQSPRTGSMSSTAQTIVDGRGNDDLLNAAVRQPAFDPTFSDFDASLMVPDLGQEIFTSVLSDPLLGLSDVFPSASAPRLSWQGTHLITEDQFDSTILTRTAPVLIQYYTDVLLPEIFFYDTQTISWRGTRHADAIHSDMTACTEDAFHLYAFLTYVTASMLSREGCLLISDITTGEAGRLCSFFRSRAVELSSSQITTQIIPDKHFMINQHRLMAAAIIEADLVTAEAHYQTMLPVTSSLDGIELFDDYFVELIILSDFIEALKSLTVPRFKPHWDPGPWSRVPSPGNRGSRKIVKTSASGLEELAINLKLQPWITLAVQNLAEVGQVCNNLTQQIVYRADAYRWASRRRMAIGYSILSTPPAVLKLFSPLDEVFRLALLFFISIIHSPLALRAIISAQRRNLLDKIKGMGVSGLWKPHTAVLLWISFTAASTSDGVQDDTEEKELLELCIACVRELAITTLPDLESLLNTRFFYDVRIQRHHLVRLGTKIWPESGGSSEMFPLFEVQTD